MISDCLILKIFNINEKNVLKRKNGIPFRSDKKSIKTDEQKENSGEKKLQKLIFN